MWRNYVKVTVMAVVTELEPSVSLQEGNGSGHVTRREAELSSLPSVCTGNTQGTKAKKVRSKPVVVISCFAFCCCEQLSGVDEAPEKDRSPSLVAGAR